MPRLFLVDSSDVPPPTPEVAGLDRARRLRTLVDGHIDFVARVLRNAGTPEAEIDDEVQRTFIVLARRLDDVRPGSEKSFLLRTALNGASHVRRTLARRREVGEHRAPELLDERADPEQLLDQQNVRRSLDAVLEQMGPDLREVFVLYEIEEMSMVEIAEVLAIPPGTVASRLRRARAAFRAGVELVEQLADLPRKG